MKATAWVPVALVLLASCGPRPTNVGSQETATAVPSRTPAPTSTTTPTLPPTHVFGETATPTPPAEPIFESVKMSAEDEAAYNQALEDIEKYRKGDLVIRLQDASGAPLAGYRIEYRQTGHDFWFGTVGDPTTADIAKAAGLNGVTVLPQWWLVEPQDGHYELGFADFWTGIGELASLGLRIKTNDMWNPAGDPEYMKGRAFDSYLELLEDHVATLVKHYASSVDQWEAVLEPNFGNHNPYGWTHDQYMQAISTSIRGIRANDPTARVEINLSYPCGGIEWLDNFAIVEEMLQRNIDFDVLGLQLYYNSYILNPSPYPMTRMSLSEMSACVDRYQRMVAPYGKSIAGSEICVPAHAPAGVAGYWGQPWSEDLQAQYLTTAYTIFFAKPLNHSLTWWDFQSVPPGGFTYEGGLIDAQQRRRKGYYALAQLIEGWTSSGNGQSDTEGVFGLRGFGGNYELLITDPATGRRMRTQAHLTEQESQDITIEFAVTPELEPLEEALGRLISYWREQADEGRVQAGRDALALAGYHSSRGEVDRAIQTLRDTLGKLAVTRTITISASSFKQAAWRGSSRPIYDGGWAVIWMYQTLYKIQDFPPGHATVKVTAASGSAGGARPMMVVGIGGQYSPPILVDHPGQYTVEMDLPKREVYFTIRLVYYGEDEPWEGPDGGEFKLMIDDAVVEVEVQDIVE